MDGANKSTSRREKRNATLRDINKRVILNTRNSIVNQISEINFQGNITPKIWYKNLVNEKGKPNLKAITILSEVVYWYRASEKRTERNGSIKYAVKFHSDKLQLSYQRLDDDFGFTKEESRAAIEFLEERKLVSREFRTVKFKTGIQNNVMFLEPNPIRIKEITFTELPSSENSNEPSRNFITGLVGNNQLPSSENSNDNTKITTKNSTQITTNKIREEITFPSPNKLELFFEHHNECLIESNGTREPDIMSLDILATKLENSIELYDKLLERKKNSSWDVRRNQPNTAKWLLRTLENEPLNGKQILTSSYVDKSEGGFK